MDAIIRKKVHGKQAGTLLGAGWAIGPKELVRMPWPARRWDLLDWVKGNVGRASRHPVWRK